MAYMLLILEGHDDRQNRGLEQGRVAYESMVRFGEDLGARGLLKGADALKQGATRVTVQDGRRNVLDGPFTEAKEIVGGFFLLDCRTKDEAVAIAQTCPAAAWATIEVREVGTCFDDLS